MNTLIVGQDADKVPRPVRTGPDGSLQFVSTETVQVTSTRPADTTAYTAGDAVGGTTSAILRFANISSIAGASVLIGSVTLQINVTSVPSGMGTQRLHLYNAQPDAIADNAAWDLLSDGDRGKHLGWIDLPAPTDLGSTIKSQMDQINKIVKLAAGSKDLWAIRQTLAGYTPTSGAVSVITMSATPV